MSHDVFKYMKTYMTYKELFGFNYDKKELIELIFTLPLGGLFQILSQLGSFHGVLEHKEIREDFIQFLESAGVDKYVNVHVKLQESLLYTPQGLLTVWKWLLAYGDKEKLTMGIDLRVGVNIILYLCLIVSDYLYVETTDGVGNEMIRNFDFNASEDMRSSIARTWCIYNELARDSSLYNPKTFVNFHSDFQTRYGFGIEEYLSTMFGLSALFVNNTKKFIPNWQQNLDKAFSNTLLADGFRNIVDPLLFDFDHGQKWALDILDSPWDFRLLYDKPLFLTGDKTFIPVMPSLLFKKAFLRLFFQVRRCYPSSDKRFFNFMGEPFEKYAILLMQEACKTSTLPYQVIPEFEYGKGNSKKSPDVMLKLGNKLLVVEVKNKTMTAASLIDGIPSAVEKDKKKLVLDPLVQAHDALKDLIKEKAVDILDVDEIYLMVVLSENFPSLPPFERSIGEEINKRMELPIKAHFHLDIEEYELLCYLVSRPNGRQIFKILNNKANLYPELPFKTFLHQSRLPTKRLKFVQEKSLQAFNQMKQILSPVS